MQEQDGLFEPSYILFTLGKYIVSANKNASIAKVMLTEEGCPRGALLLSVMAVRNPLFFFFHNEG